LLVFKRNREEPLAVLRWTDLLSLLRHDHRWQNLAEGLTGAGHDLSDHLPKVWQSPGISRELLGRL